jgi:hypothetical protein
MRGFFRRTHHDNGYNLFQSAIDANDYPIPGWAKAIRALLWTQYAILKVDMQVNQTANSPSRN